MEDDVSHCDEVDLAGAERDEESASSLDRCRLEDREQPILE